MANPPPNHRSGLDSSFKGTATTPFAADDALAQAERVDAERLIRATVETLSRGAPLSDLDGLVQRSVGRMSAADIRAGRVGSQVLGDIISTVEQAKGNAPFNWLSATPEQVKAYLLANGHDPARMTGMAGMPSRGEATTSVGAGKGESAPVSMASVTQQNFGNSAFAAAGLSYGTFSALRGEGFSAAQIMSAVGLNKELGLGANSNPGATARLQRDVPSAIPGLHSTRDNWKQTQELEQAEKKARGEGNTAEADRLKRGADDARKRAEEHDKQERERVRSQKPEREKDLIDKQDEIRRGVQGQAAKLAPDAVETIEAYRRNPNDASARKNYEALKARGVGDPNRERALAKVESGLQNDAKLKGRVEGLQAKEATKIAEKVQAVEEKTAVKAAIDKGNDDLLAALNDGPSTKHQKAETSDKPTQGETTVAAKKANTEKLAPASPTKPEKLRTATAKPAGLTA